MRRTRLHAARGFTFMELVVVIAIAGILAAFAASRINTLSFDTEGFTNQTTAMIRYAQKVAIAQRRSVSVVFSGSPDITKITLCYAIDPACSGANIVREPPGAALFERIAPSGVKFDPATSFTFTALGRPNLGQTVVIKGDVNRSIVIEAETGYVR